MGAGREEVMRKGGGEESRSVRRWRAVAVAVEVTVAVEVAASIVATPAMSTSLLIATEV